MFKPFMAESGTPLCCHLPSVESPTSAEAQEKKESEICERVQNSLFLTGLSWFSVIRVLPQCFHSQRWKSGHSNRVVCVCVCVKWRLHSGRAAQSRLGWTGEPLPPARVESAGCVVKLLGFISSRASWLMLRRLHGAKWRLFR